MKALIIGLGGVGQRHVRNLRAIVGDGLELIAWRVRRLAHVVTPSLQSDATRDVEAEYGIRAFDSLEGALAARPEVAFICNPTSLHVPAALACVRAGCDVFLEKPVSHNLDCLDELEREVKARERIVMVGYQMRFHPCFRRLREIVREGLVGDLLAVRATVGEYLPGWHPYEDYRTMYASRADLGGGVLVTQIHEFDYLYALFGLPRRVFSVGGKRSTLEIDVEDTASTLMDYDGLPVHLQQDYVQRPPSRSCEIVGTRGKAVMDFPTLSLTRWDDAGAVAERASWEGFDRNQLFMDETRHFLECVSARSKPEVDLADGIASLRMALAARESMRTGEVVEVGARG
jgi:predicted dehydrogenase